MDNKFNKEYYIIGTDGANKHPLLTWGEGEHDSFLYPEPIETEDIELPLRVKMRKPVPSEVEFADILFLDGHFIVSEKTKNILEDKCSYKIQFFPVEIMTNEKKNVSGHYILHIWNGISAVDKNNYEGSEPDEDGEIDDLKKFSIDEEVLKNISLERRLIFHLSESFFHILIEESIYEALKKENVTGFSFFRIDQWNEDSMFR